jgi:hypothetical protein
MRRALPIILLLLAGLALGGDGRIEEWEDIGSPRYSFRMPGAPNCDALPTPDTAELDLQATAGERAGAETVAPRPQSSATRVLIHRYNE